MRKILALIIIIPVRIYQYAISPFLPASCRHFPSCSQYTNEAIKLHGPAKGSILALNRIGRCHPWGTQGFDPVPKFIFRKMKIKGPCCDRLK
ncbi:MAG: membrane protein insertion efficiency factor YidD [Bacteroidales bacterium]|nr:membrane protein insertion efficiency factor YidD [Bacteroidales bacterium]